MQYIFTEPLAWLLRRKKKGWGVVYNSVTKKPVDLAVIRLRDKTTGKLLKSRVTDREGRYNFLVSEGSYLLEVIKPKMIFPSIILKDLAEDKQFTNLYHGESIVISKEQKGIITANIPVDQEGIELSDKKIIRNNFRYKLQKNVNLIGPIFAIVSFAIFPSLLIGSFAVVHIALYFLFRRLVAKEKVNKWGVVLDAKTGKPVAGTVTKIYSPEYNKMLEAQVTDSHGRYGFLAGNNVYYISAFKEGYNEAKTGNLDLTHKKSEEVISQDIKLQPISNSTTDLSAKNPQLLSGDLPETEAIKNNTEVTSDTPAIEKEPSPLDEIAKKINQAAELNQIRTENLSTDNLLPEAKDKVLVDNDNQSTLNTEIKDEPSPVLNETIKSKKEDIFG